MDSSFVTFPPKTPTRELYLIGFRLDPEVEGPQFFTLVGSEGEIERPITCCGRVLFFHKPSDASSALTKSDNGFRDVRPVPSELELLCDVGEALYVANQKDADDDGVLFELIAVFDDLLHEVKLTVPPEYAKILAATAERLSESPEFASFLSATGITREKLEDALLWCAGAIMVKSTWVG